MSKSFNVGANGFHDRNPPLYENSAMQENVERLRQRGVYVAGPAMGHLASGLSGMSRLLETTD